MKTPKILVTMTLLTLLCGLAGGCNSVPVAPLPVTPQDSTAAILRDPQFPAMARAAPDLTKRVLRRITELETEKANSGHE